MTNRRLVIRVDRWWKYSRRRSEARRRRSAAAHRHWYTACSSLPLLFPYFDVGLPYSRRFKLSVDTVKLYLHHCKFVTVDICVLFTLACLPTVVFSIMSQQHILAGNVTLYL